LVYWRKYSRQESQYLNFEFLFFLLPHRVQQLLAALSKYLALLALFASFAVFAILSASF
jgi:hypothetical protein